MEITTHDYHKTQQLVVISRFDWSLKLNGLKSYCTLITDKTGRFLNSVWLNLLCSDGANFRKSAMAPIISRILLHLNRLLNKCVLGGVWIIIFILFHVIYNFLLLELKEYIAIKKRERERTAVLEENYYAIRHVPCMARSPRKQISPRSLVGGTRISLSCQS